MSAQFAPRLILLGPGRSAGMPVHVIAPFDPSATNVTDGDRAMIQRRRQTASTGAVAVR